MVAVRDRRNETRPLGRADERPLLVCFVTRPKPSPRSPPTPIKLNAVSAPGPSAPRRTVFCARRASRPHPDRLLCDARSRSIVLVATVASIHALVRPAASGLAMEAVRKPALSQAPARTAVMPRAAPSMQLVATCAAAASDPILNHLA